MALKRKKVVVYATESTTDVRGGNMGNRGAGDALFMLVGRAVSGAYNGVYRGYAYFDIDQAMADGDGWDDVRTITDAYVEVTTRDKDAEEVSSGVFDQSIFGASSDSKVRIHRLLRQPAWTGQGDGYLQNPLTPPPDQSHWDSDDFTGVGKDDWSDEYWEEFITPTRNVDSTIPCVGLVGAWAPATAGGHPVKWRDPDEGGGALKKGGNKPNRGIVLKTPKETKDETELRFEVWSHRAPTQGYRPRLVFYYIPWNAAPDAPRIVEPKGNVPPDFEFRALVSSNVDEDPIASVDIETRKKPSGGSPWSTSVQSAADWPPGEVIAPNPRHPDIPYEEVMEVRMKATTAGGTASPWSDWTEFKVVRRGVEVTPTPVGPRSTMEGLRLHADWSL